MRLRNYRFGFSVSVAACSAYASYAMAIIVEFSPNRRLQQAAVTISTTMKKTIPTITMAVAGKKQIQRFERREKKKKRTERNTQAIALVKERRPTDRVVGRKLKRRPMFSRGKRSKVVASVKRERANTLDEVRRRGTKGYRER